MFEYRDFESYGFGTMSFDPGRWVFFVDFELLVVFKRVLRVGLCCWFLFLVRFWILWAGDEENSSCSSSSSHPALRKTFLDQFFIYLFVFMG